MGGTQRGFIDTVSVKREPGPLEVLIEVVHPPGSGGRFQEEPGLEALIGTRSLAWSV